MPYRPKKIKRSWKQPRIAFGRRKDNSKFYNSMRWRKTSKIYRDENPFCKECERKGLVGPAEVVDHIRGLQYLLDNNIDPYDYKELEGMCHSHHNSKSGKQSHGYRGVIT